MKKIPFLEYVRGNYRNWLMMIAGTFLTAAGTSLFFTPAKIVCGGVSGISTILFHFGGIPIGLSYWGINAVLLLLGIRVLGREFIVKTILGTTLMSLFMDALTYVTIMPESAELASIFGGLFYGVGLGLTFLAGASTGGTDILGRLLQHFFPSMKIGTILMVIDAVIIAISYAVFTQIDLVLLGILGVFIQTIAIDSLIARMNVSDTAFIVTENGPQIAQMLLHEFERGVTVMEGTGAYTQRHKQVLMCVMNKQESAALQDRVKQMDENAFVIFSESKSVLGNGFHIYR